MTATKWRRERRTPTAGARPRPGAPHRRPAWYLIVLAAAGVVATVLGILQIGSPTSSARTAKEIVTAERGIVQATVTGSGEVEPAVDDSASFQTSGTLQHLYVKQGDHVVKGQLLATLDPTSAQDTVDQAEQELTAAKDSLSAADTAAASGSPTDSSSAVDRSDDTSFVAYSTTGATSTTSTTTTASGPAPTTTAPTPSTTTNPTTTTVTVTAPSSTTTPASGTGGEPSGSGTGSSAQTTTSDPDTLAANVASAQAQVDSAEATLKTAQTALTQTKLYAPASGTVVSVDDVSPGDAVSGSSTSGSDSSSSDSSSDSSSGSTGGTTSGSLGGSSSDSTTGASSSSSTGLVEIVNTHTMTVTVPFDESDISKLKVRQPATVTFDALTGVELAAKVSSISTIGTTSDSVVSYDATLTLTQRDAEVKPGMTASAAVIDQQASGVTLPNDAVPGTSNTATVNVSANGKTTATKVIVGLRGDSRTQIVKGLSVGQRVVVTETLPSTGGSSDSSSGSSSSSGTLGGAGGVAGAAAGSGFAGRGGFAGGGGRFGGG
jgi:membrane fusion protein, macrolide-specific efflux system